MERRTISNPKLDALLVVFVLAFMAAILSPVILEYSTWRWYTCAAFAGTAVLAVFVRRRIAAREANRVYRELLPSSRAGRRIAAVIYAFIGILAIAGVIGFAYVAVHAFRTNHLRLGCQMAGFAVASVLVVGSAVRSIRLQMQKPNRVGGGI